MELRGRRIPMVFSLIVWFVLWEVIGRLGLISLIPPFSESIMAMAEVVPSETFIEVPRYSRIISVSRVASVRARRRVLRDSS